MEDHWKIAALGPLVCFAVAGIWYIGFLALREASRNRQGRLLFVAYILLLLNLVHFAISDWLAAFVFIILVGILLGGICSIGVLIFRAIRRTRRGRALSGAFVLALFSCVVWAFAYWSANEDLEYTKQRYINMLHRLRALHAAAKAEAQAGRGGSWPPNWRECGPEPRCLERDGGAPFGYTPVANVAVEAERRPETWIARSPMIRRHYWWAPWLGLRRCYFLRADGSTGSAEEEALEKQAEGTSKEAAGRN